jgi:guanylate kinase
MSVVLVISAASGSGKSTLLRRLLEAHPEMMFSVSYTTRAPRGQERDGVDYHYVSREEFEQRLAAGEFLEHAEVFGHYYGTHRGAVDEARAQGRDVVLDIDVQGARQLKSKLPDAVTIFILAPSRAELERRLRARAEDTEETIQRRLKAAAGEIARWNDYDYVVVNGDVEESVKTLEAILRAERCRSERMGPALLPVLESFGQAGGDRS